RRSGSASAARSRELRSETAPEEPAETGDRSRTENGSILPSEVTHRSAFVLPGLSRRPIFFARVSATQGKRTVAAGGKADTMSTSLAPMCARTTRASVFAEGGSDVPSAPPPPVLHPHDRPSPPAPPP